MGAGIVKSRRSARSKIADRALSRMVLGTNRALRSKPAAIRARAGSLITTTVSATATFVRVSPAAWDTSWTVRPISGSEGSFPGARTGKNPPTIARCPGPAKFTICARAGIRSPGRAAPLHVPGVQRSQLECAPEADQSERRGEPDGTKTTDAVRLATVAIRKTGSRPIPSARQPKVRSAVTVTAAWTARSASISPAPGPRAGRASAVTATVTPMDKRSRSWCPPNRCTCRRAEAYSFAKGMSASDGMPWTVGRLVMRRNGSCGIFCRRVMAVPAGCAARRRLALGRVSAPIIRWNRRRSPATLLFLLPLPVLDVGLHALPEACSD